VFHPAKLTLPEIYETDRRASCDMTPYHFPISILGFGIRPLYLIVFLVFFRWVGSPFVELSEVVFYEGSFEVTITCQTYRSELKNHWSEARNNCCIHSGIMMLLSQIPIGWSTWWNPGGNGNPWKVNQPNNFLISHDVHKHIYSPNRIDSWVNTAVVVVLSV